MTMTAAQMVDLFREQAEMSWAAVQAAKSSANYDLAAFNASAAFDSQLMTALIQWRLGEDPRPNLTRACAMVGDGLAVLASLQPGAPHWRLFDFSQAGFLGLLGDQALPKEFEPRLSEWRTHAVDHLGQFLDRALVAAIRNGEEPPEWGPMIASLTANPRFGLFRETYSAYMEAITRRPTGAVDHALQAASRAAGLFRKRESDSYYAGGRGTDGGGPDNAYVVDFRLAALIRKRLPEAASSLAPGERTHVWRW
jgi:hypothetical protein